MFLLWEVTLHTPQILTVWKVILKFLIVGPRQIFFFLALFDCWGIKVSYSVGILTGIQNQTCVRFQSGVVFLNFQFFQEE